MLWLAHDVFCWYIVVMFLFDISFFLSLIRYGCRSATLGHVRYTALTLRRLRETWKAISLATAQRTIGSSLT